MTVSPVTFYDPVTDQVIMVGGATEEEQADKMAQLRERSESWLRRHENAAAIADFDVALQAIAACRAYLDLQAPTNIQVLAQVRLLTRISLRLIRYALADAHPELLDDTDETEV